MTAEELDFEVAMIIAQKKADGNAPFAATLLELSQATGEDVFVLLPAMRELVKCGRYKGAVTVNKIPMLL